MIGTEEMASDCIRGGEDWILGNISSPEGLSSTGTGLPRAVVESSSLEVFKRCVETQIHRMVRVERDLKDHLVPTPLP